MIARRVRRTAYSPREGPRTAFARSAMVGSILAVLVGAAARGQELESAPASAPAARSEAASPSTIADRQELVAAPADFKPDTRLLVELAVLPPPLTGSTTPAAAEEPKPFIRIVQLDPQSMGAYTYRAVLDLLVLHDRDRALADLDRALAIDPRGSLHYALRSYLHGAKKEFVPALRDLVLCVRTLGLIEIRFIWRYDSGRRLGFVGFAYGLKEPDPDAKPGPATAGIESQCIDSSIRRLAAEAWRRWTIVPPTS
jgi:hypothetical protein